MVNYQTLLDDIADDLEGLSTTAYGWPEPDGSATTDRWKRVRKTDDRTARHLEFWVDLGEGIIQGDNRLRHEGALIFDCRLPPDDTYTAEARARNAALAALSALRAGPYTEARIVPQGYTLEQREGPWVRVICTFLLHITAWR